MMAQHEARTATTPQPLKTWKCWRCGRTIARLFLLPGCTIEIKCGSCNAINMAAVDKTTPKA